MSVKQVVVTGSVRRGVLSPLLWCLVLDELLIILEMVRVYVQAYADDQSNMSEMRRGSVWPDAAGLQPKNGV